MAEIEETVISPAVEEVAERLRVSVNSLPAHALKDLISLGACVRCIFWLFGVYEGISTDAFLSLSPSILCAVLGKVMDLDRNVVTDNSSGSVDTSNLQCSQELDGESSFCKICLGVLQFIYHDQQGVLFKRDHAHDFASIIAENVKQECHEIDNFLLEVSLPPVITRNEQAILLYMTRKYESEIWFKEKFLSRSFSVKDLFQLSIIHPLEKLLGVQSGQSSFRIRIAYDHLDTSPKVQNNKIERDHHNKRMKTEDSGFHSAEGNGLAKVSNKSMQGCTTSDWSKFQLEKVQKPCQMTFTFCRTPIYFGGRYLKYSRNVSQSRWIIDDERKGDASVEEIIGSSILPVCRGDSYKFHAAGREDIDVRMLGSGRPFLIEIQNARRVPSELSVKEIERKINSMETKLVSVKNVEVLGSEGWALMHEGEAEKQKQYAALVWISRCIKDDDVQTISLMKDLQILQRTPIRVLHRRSPLEREKIIHWMKVEKLAGSSQYFLLHLCTQAGTYIKEFVHGDLGRTHPSIGSILGCRAEILQLDVTDVKMDCFLTQ